MATVLAATVVASSSLPLAQAAYADDTNSLDVKTKIQFVNAATGKPIAPTIEETTNDFNKEYLKSFDDYELNNISKTVYGYYLPKETIYMFGYPDKTFKPNQGITRAEFMAVMYRLYDGDFPKEVRQWNDKEFKDVDQKSWYFKSLKKMYELGLVNGSDGKMYPNQPITRAELASLVIRLAGVDVNEENPLSYFKDVNPEMWYGDSVNAAAEKGFIAGYNLTEFKPDAPIKRSEVTAIVNKALNRDFESIAKVVNPYKDVNKDDWFFNDVISASVKHLIPEMAKDLKLDTTDYVYTENEGKIIDQEKDVKEKSIEPKKLVGFKFVGNFVEYDSNYTPISDTQEKMKEKEKSDKQEVWYNYSSKGLRDVEPAEPPKLSAQGPVVTGTAKDSRFRRYININAQFHKNPKDGERIKVEVGNNGPRGTEGNYIEYFENVNDFLSEVQIARPVGEDDPIRPEMVGLWISIVDNLGNNVYPTDEGRIDYTPTYQLEAKVRGIHINRSYLYLKSEKPNTRVTITVLRGGKQVLEQKAVLQKVGEHEKVFLTKDGAPFKLQIGDDIDIYGESGPDEMGKIYTTNPWIYPLG